MTHRYLVWLYITAVAFSLICSPIHAQQADSSGDYPTLTALQQAIVPTADYVALAQRFRGVGEIPAPPTSAPLRRVGEEEMFWISNSAEDHETRISATLRVIGQHAYWWVEDRASVDESSLQTLADAFDNRVYDSVRALWGSEAIPGIDGDARLYVLFAHDLGRGTAAYFLSRHTYPRAVFPTSNEHEMLFYNLDQIDGSKLSDLLIESNIAHEFQHMIRANIQRNEDYWLNEGFSTFTQVYLYRDPGAIYSFLSAPQVQLNTWSSGQPNSAHYGAAMTFVDYFYERYGLEAIRALSADPNVGLNAFDDVLRQLGKPGVNEFFADWVLANFLLSPDTGYGYHLFPSDLSSPPPLAVVTDYPFSQDGVSNQYAADYYVLTNLKGKTQLDIQLDASSGVQLLPTEASSGQWMWYSNKGDVSDSTLTHAFDLTGVKQATLSYRAWYSIENLWDYGYVSVSTNGGETWKPFTTPDMTATDPLSTAYGTGYTGESDGWLDETVSLDSYAGKSILVRFEVITDDAITQPGLAVDDVHIPEIGYESDFESDGGGWEGAGWVRTDNRLPQQVWVQAVQQMGKQVQVSRWLAPAENHWTLPLEQGVEQVLIALSPFAPVTTVPAAYTLLVNAQ
jgi:immune inhibitor A